MLKLWINNLSLLFSSLSLNVKSQFIIAEPLFWLHVSVPLWFAQKVLDYEKSNPTFDG